jgi:hypothetical protein
MVLNTHTPYDDLSDGEEEWEFLNSHDITPTDLQLSEQPPPIAATPSAAATAAATGTIDLETTGSKDDVVVQSADANSNKEHHVTTEAKKEFGPLVENRQDENESNISASTAGRSNYVSSVGMADEAEQANLNDLEMKEEAESVASGTNNNNIEDEEDSTAPPQQHAQNNTNDPLRNTWNFIENTFQGIDNQHQLRQRTRNSVQHINRSMQTLFSNITDETQRVRNQADVHARNASTQVCHAASSARESICRANTEYKLSEKVATVAVIGGATLLALGNPRAGVTALAVAGASLAVGEVISSNESDRRNREEYGLSEGVHID